MSDSDWYVVKCRVGLSPIPHYRPVAGPSMMAFLLIHNRKHKASILTAFIMSSSSSLVCQRFPLRGAPVRVRRRALAARLFASPWPHVESWRCPNDPLAASPWSRTTSAPASPGRATVVREREVGADWGMNEVCDEFDPSVYERWMWLS